jgi:hypothetical protein
MTAEAAFTTTWSWLGGRGGGTEAPAGRGARASGGDDDDGEDRIRERQHGRCDAAAQQQRASTDDDLDTTAQSSDRGAARSTEGRQGGAEGIGRDDLGEPAHRHHDGQDLERCGQGHGCNGIVTGPLRTGPE